MGRRELREQIFLLLFRVEFNDKDAMQQQKELFFEDGTVAVSEDGNDTAVAGGGINVHGITISKTNDNSSMVARAFIPKP